MKIKYTHNYENDTELTIEDGKIIFTFTDVGLLDDPDYREVATDKLVTDLPASTLFEALANYYEHGENEDLFDGLSLPAQDALNNVLLHVLHRGWA